ncbi:MAG: tripartite tricarboxylate transporter substrate binding protein [Burkholderiaceae bacterium]|nr:tripartite tricarboxylate transporter substrate binding protein [Burkholderiaceae bacterium]
MNILNNGRLSLLRSGRLALLSGFVGAFAVGAVSAQTWPAGRTVSIINPAAPGGSSDPLARIAAEILTNAYGGSFIVENRQGANGNIGAAYVAKAQPDGYTLLMSWTGTLVSAVTMYGSKPFNPMTDFEPIVLIGSIPNVITVDAKLPIRNLTELTEYARKHPGEINFGSTGSGSSWHLAAELYKKVLGVQMTHVPYTSPAAVTKDLVGGQLQAVFPGTMAIASLVKEGRLRALAVMAEQRTPVLPDVPTTKELGYPQLMSATWMALLAPKGTPVEITTKINKAINVALADPKYRDRLVNMGYTPMGGTPAQFTAYMAAEITKWDEIVKFSGAKID